MMTLEEIAIYNEMKFNNQDAYITPNGLRLYLKVDGGLMCLTGQNFGSMTDDEINKFIQETLS